jgi:flagellar basal body-associated protein FliL
MNLLSLILIAMGIIVAVCVFYIAWELSSDKSHEKKGPGESKESGDPPSP